jgi:hypothetical protein
MQHVDTRNLNAEISFILILLVECALCVGDGDGGCERILEMCTFGVEERDDCGDEYVN